MVRLQEKLPTVRRLVCLNPGELWTGSDESTDERLGRAIERLRVLGSTTVVVDAFGRNAAGAVDHAWFPTDALPVKADVLSRIVWQLQTRAGVEVHVRVPASGAIGGPANPERTLKLFRDLGAGVPLSGLFIDDTPALAALNARDDSFAGRPWETRAARDSIAAESLPLPEQTAIRAFREVQRARPWASLTLVTDKPGNGGSIADLTLQNISIPADGQPLPSGSDQQIKETTSRRSGIWLTGPTPPKAVLLRAATRRYQQLGGTALGWCPDYAVTDTPVAREVEPDVSAATFPVRF